LSRLLVNFSAVAAAKDVKDIGLSGRHSLIHSDADALGWIRIVCIR